MISLLLAGWRATIHFLREVFSEGGQGSFSRVAQGVIVLSVVGWVWYLVVKNHALPDLGGPSLFIGTGAAGHYGINKASDIVASFRGSAEISSK